MKRPLSPTLAGLYVFAAFIVPMAFAAALFLRLSP
jgi:hypothetical protein